MPFRSGDGHEAGEFITLLGSAAAWPLTAHAQQPEQIRRVGVLVGLAENDPEIKARLAGFRQGLEKFGWSEGSNLRIDYRFAPAGAQAQLLARELVALQPDVILAQSTPATIAVQAESRTIPIVFAGPDRFRSRRELAAPGRQSHWASTLRGGHHGQVAGDAQRDCAEPDPRRSSGQSQNHRSRSRLCLSRSRTVLLTFSVPSSRSHASRTED
jgi:ABC transporter substrate binding protein